jgi:poly(3-hydroxybutyrate) depolymerase
VPGAIALLLQAIAMAVALSGCSAARQRDRPLGEGLAPTPGWTRTVLPSDGHGRREVWVYVPFRRTGKPMPLVISLHGNGGSGAEESLRWGDLAEREGLVVACPDSRGSHTGDPADYPADEAAVLAVRETLLRTHPVDPGRVLLTGYSGGALAAMVTAMHRPELFAALAVRSPSFPHVLLDRRDWVTAAAKRGLPVMIQLGDSDRPETREDVEEADRLLRSCGYLPPTLLVVRLRGVGHDGSAALPGIVRWFKDQSPSGGAIPNRSR